MRVQNSRWYGKVNAYIPSREWVYKIPDQVGLVISSKIFRTEVCLEEERKSRDNESLSGSGAGCDSYSRRAKGLLRSCLKAVKDLLRLAQPVLHSHFFEHSFGFFQVFDAKSYAPGAYAKLA